MTHRVALIVALALSSAAPLDGQVRVGLSALLGGYLPATNLFESVRLGDADQPIILNLGHEPGIVGGGRLTVRLSRLALEAEAGYVLSNLDIPSAVADEVPSDASIFLASLSALYDIYRAPFSPLSIYLLGGGGLVARSGELFDTLEGTTDLAGVLGLGLRFGLEPAVFLRFDLRDYISSWAPRAPDGFQFDSTLQNELIGTVAVEFSLTPSQ
ncbi:MAG: outer membrane beta-barrel protein [Gemmatimonadales bacterium]|jgi:hypothetical protein